ncbi:BRCT domain-containing protein [Stachybotrys elegans]|uniref:BRCT domain-containing protein n=1 Tax=Stachybotrys elegans TaxID=80388 RepID=A0A8K0SQ86_9HYPO|nr:BRCT domain-containing protein [Stachybotrys elegans]
MKDAQASGIFNECAIAFVPNKSLTPKYISDLSSILEDNGATICEPRRDGTIPIEQVTHIVSNTIDFPQYIESQAIMIPVVTVEWVNMSVKRRKQAQVRPYSPDPRMIFSEVTVTCINLPTLDKESIIGATMALGGQESKEISRMTTHICTMSMDSEMLKAALARGWKGKVVLPHWFDACFKLGKRIAEDPYLLPDPEVTKKAPEDDLEIPTNANLQGATSANPQWLPSPSESRSGDGRPPATVFQSKRVLLSWDLNITQRLISAIKDIIVDGGGRIVQEVDDCDMFICQYRDGPQYVQAAQSCKEVGNLSWLYYLIVHNEWTSPLRRLLHYPLPKDGIEGFKGMRITVSNYGGEARIYLENLIKACGAEFTKTMKSDNTHLITARDTSEKCKAAPEWGISVVNHLWIEESYAKCEVKPLTIRKYSHFPPRTNLGEIIGQTFFDESRLRELYYPGGDEQMSPRAKRKRKILEAAEENAYNHGPAEGVVIGRADQGSDVEEAPEELRRSARKKRATTEVEEVATPIRTRHVRSGKENETPSMLSTGGRSAKAKAREILQAIVPDIELYEKEKKRHSKTGAAPWGGKRAADMAEKERAEKSSAAPSNDEAEDAESKRPPKKARPSLPDVELRIILTSFNRWVGDQKTEDRDRRKLRNLGIQIVGEGQACDYLAAPHIVRTVKFLTALARGPKVISSTFVEKALEMGELPDVDEFLLQDKESETRYNFKLQTSVARAKSHCGKLLWGIPIYCTEKVRNGPDSYRSIAQANGAIFKLYRARSGVTIKPTTAEEDGNAPPEPVYLLSGVSHEEKNLWAKFKDMAEKGHMEPRIVAPDWLLDVAMAQQVRFDSKFLAENFFKDQAA